MDVLGFLRAAGVHQQFHQAARSPLGNDVQAGPPLVVGTLRVAPALEQRDAGPRGCLLSETAAARCKRSYPPLVANELVGVRVQTCVRDFHAAMAVGTSGALTPVAARPPLAEKDAGPQTHKETARSPRLHF